MARIPETWRGVVVRLHYSPIRRRSPPSSPQPVTYRPVTARFDPPRGFHDVVTARPASRCSCSSSRRGPGRRSPGRREAVRPGAAHPLERLARGRLARPAAALQGRAGLPQADDQAALEPGPRAGDRTACSSFSTSITGPGRAACSPSGTTRTRPRPRSCSRSTASPSAWPSTPTTSATATSTSA